MPPHSIISWSHSSYHISEDHVWHTFCCLLRWHTSGIRDVTKRPLSTVVATTSPWWIGSWCLLVILVCGAEADGGLGGKSIITGWIGTQVDAVLILLLLTLCRDPAGASNDGGWYRPVHPLMSYHWTGGYHRSLHHRIKRYLTPPGSRKIITSGVLNPSDWLCVVKSRDISTHWKECVLLLDLVEDLSSLQSLSPSMPIEQKLMCSLWWLHGEGDSETAYVVAQPTSYLSVIIYACLVRFEQSKAWL